MIDEEKIRRILFGLCAFGRFSVTKSKMTEEELNFCIANNYITKAKEVEIAGWIEINYCVTEKGKIFSRYI